MSNVSQLTATHASDTFPEAVLSRRDSLPSRSDRCRPLSGSCAGRV